VRLSLSLRTATAGTTAITAWTATTGATRAARAARATKSTATTHQGAHINFKSGPFEFFQLGFLGVSEDGHGSVTGLFTGCFHLFAHGVEAGWGATGTGGTAWGTRSTSTLE
jgi:hypothetical protein